ncbi:MAG: hypothetical protein E6G93_13625 [Alphaproteobacteria bacterium]|nr:MAG: hypothetical protein E6G93_13625 [Alphaproteobacteria bacterium]
MPVEEAAPVPLVDEENAPEPLVDAVTPLIDPGIVEVGTLNGSQAAAADVRPTGLLNGGQDVCAGLVALGLTPEFT